MTLGFGALRFLVLGLRTGWSTGETHHCRGVAGIDKAILARRGL